MYDHIVFMSIDTLRSDCIGANPLKLWPHKYPNLTPPATDILDELVEQGCFFANCVSAAPYTSASHASIFTGKWPMRHGVYEFFNRKLSCDTVFTRAREDGYSTVFKSDFPLILGPQLGFDRGIDRFIVEDDEAYLDAIASTRKSVSLAHFGGVHVPYGFHNLRYGGDAYRRKLIELEDDVGKPKDLPKDQLLETPRDAEDTAMLLRYKRVIQELWQAGRAEAIFGLYLQGVEHFLAARFEPFVRKLLKTLHGTRWLMVIFGDHGEEYDEDSFGHFNSVAEGVLRVPVIFLGSDVMRGTYTERVATVDILPTIYEMHRPGRRRGPKMDGVSRAGTVIGGAPYESQPAYAQAYVADTARFVRFQRRSLGDGRKRGSLPHLLFKETGWAGSHKLSRTLAHFERYLGGLVPLERPITRLERFGPDSVPVPETNPAIQLSLEALLSEYNAMRKNSRSKEPKLV